jgi:hypothetical protein
MLLCHFKLLNQVVVGTNWRMPCPQLPFDLVKVFEHPLETFLVYRYRVNFKDVNIVWFWLRTQMPFSNWLNSYRPGELTCQGAHQVWDRCGRPGDVLQVDPRMSLPAPRRGFSQSHCRLRASKLLQLLISAVVSGRKTVSTDVTNEVKRTAVDLVRVRIGGQRRRPKPPSGYNHDVLQHRNSAQGQPLPENARAKLWHDSVFKMVTWKYGTSRSIQEPRESTANVVTHLFLEPSKGCRE